MKTHFLVAVVILLHCVMIGSLFFIQGCGTTRSVSSAPPPPPPITPLPPTVQPPPVQPKIAQHKPAPEKPALAPDVGEYIVQKGDTLSGIASRAGVKTEELIALNNIRDPNKVIVGQKLVLPQKGMAAPAPKKKTQPPAAADANKYVVMPGDNLTKIAAKHGTTISAIKAANSMENDKVLVGQTLVIPAAAAGESRAAPAPEPAVAESAATAEPAVTASAAMPEAPKPDVIGQEAQKTPAAETAGNPFFHVVQQFDDLKSIARLYSCTVEELARLNNLPPDAELKPGQRITVPTFK